MNIANVEANKFPETAKPRILVVDDHPLVCEAFAHLINTQPDLVCCGTAANCLAAETAIACHQPDLLLLDLFLGPGDGLEFIKSLKARFPTLRILVVSQLDETLYAERVLRAGALGYVMKDAATEELLKAIRCAVTGQLYVSSKVAMMALQRLIEQKPAVHAFDIRSLTDRELHVFKSLAGGATNKQIAAQLALSVKTIETYREHIKHKLGFATSAELVRHAGEWARRESMS